MNDRDTSFLYCLTSKSPADLLNLAFVAYRFDAVQQCRGVALFFHQSECKGEEHGKVSTKNDLTRIGERF